MRSSVLRALGALSILLCGTPPAGAELTLLGQVDTPGVAHRACVRGAIAYVAGSESVAVVDVSDPGDPMVLTTVGDDLINGSAYTGCAIVGDLLYVMVSPVGPTTILRYSLFNPVAPELEDQIAIPQYVGAGFDVSGTTAVVTTNLVRWLGGSNDIFEQDGNAIAVDLANFDTPHSSALFAGVLGGMSNLWRPALVDAQTALVTGSTATGTNTDNGVGRMLVVDVSDPAHIAVERELQIPGTVHAVGIAIDGDLALVAGSTRGWADMAPQQCCRIAGALALTTLDISDPHHPQIIATTVTPFENTAGVVTALGDRRFAVTSRLNASPAQLIDVNAANPAAIAVDGQSAIGPADVTSAGGRVYVAAAAGLAIYGVGLAAPSPTPTATLPAPSATPTLAPPTATPTEPAAPRCAGDCDGNGTVVISELIRGVNIVLGNVAVAECAALDRNGDGTVPINELIAAVNALLNGCG